MADHLHKAHLLSWYLVGQLSPSDLRGVADHLKVCAACRQELSLLRQTIAALQALPLEETSVDFGGRLNQRIDREAERHHLEEPQKHSSTSTVGIHSSQGVLPSSSRLTKSVFAALVQRGRDWWRPLCVPLPIKVLVYTGAVMLGLVALLIWRVSSEKVVVPPAQSVASAPPSPAPLPQQATSVAGEALQPVDTAMSTTKKLPPSVAPLTSSTSTLDMAAALVWRVEGNEPAALHEQVKVLVGRMAGVAIVKEEEHVLLISLPTQELAALRQKLIKMGEVRNLEADGAPGTPTTLLQVMFAQPSWPSSSPSP